MWPIGDRITTGAMVVGHAQDSQRPTRASCEALVENIPDAQLSQARAGASEHQIHQLVAESFQVVKILKVFRQETVYLMGDVSSRKEAAVHQMGNGTRQGLVSSLWVAP